MKQYRSTAANTVQYSSMQPEQAMMKMDKNFLHIPPVNNFIFTVFQERMMK